MKDGTFHKCKSFGTNRACVYTITNVYQVNISHYLSNMNDSVNKTIAFSGLYEKKLIRKMSDMMRIPIINVSPRRVT